MPTKIEGRQPYQLRKLPVWGKKISDHEIDFEWPLIDDYLGLEEPQLQSIEFKSDRIH